MNLISVLYFVIIVSLIPLFARIRIYGNTVSMTRRYVICIGLWLLAWVVFIVSEMIK